MPRLSAAAAWILLAAPSLALGQGTTLQGAPGEAGITGIGLFKNGLAIVRRTVTVPAGGRTELSILPEPVHGTLWLSSETPVEARITTRIVSEALPSEPSEGLQSDLAGKSVTVSFREPGLPPVRGRAVTGTTPARARDQAPPPGGARPGYLVLETDSGVVWVELSMIGTLQIDGQQAGVKRRRPVLELSAASTGKAVAVVMSYVTKGIGWAPAYRIDLSAATTLRIAEQAVVRNELEDLRDVELELISGFPNVSFAHVLSPFAPRTTWAEFFERVGARFAPDRGVASNVISQSLQLPGSDQDGALPIAPAAEGVDLHYHSIGRRTLAEGDALLLEIAAAEAEYSRIVEWRIPDGRSGDGRPIGAYALRADPERFEDAPWDAVTFRNPLPKPLTTAPVMFVAGDRFQGQSTTSWADPGEEVTLRVTKALRVRTRGVEVEDPDDQDLVWIGGVGHRVVRVRGSLGVDNHRNEPVTLHVRREFTGTLLEADAEARESEREEPLPSLNPRKELLWNVTVAAGAQLTLRYRYEVLVPR